MGGVGNAQGLEDWGGSCCGKMSRQQREALDVGHQLPFRAAQSTRHRRRWGAEVLLPFPPSGVCHSRYSWSMMFAAPGCCACCCLLLQDLHRTFPNVSASIAGLALLSWHCLPACPSLCGCLKSWPSKEPPGCRAACLASIPCPLLPVCPPLSLSMLPCGHPATLPQHPSMDANGRAMLRRMLAAYARRNVRVGYCQGMNFIAATFALFMSEEDAFWCVGWVGALLCGMAGAQGPETCVRGYHRQGTWQVPVPGRGHGCELTAPAGDALASHHSICCNPPHGLLLPSPAGLQVPGSSG